MYFFYLLHISAAMNQFQTLHNKNEKTILYAAMSSEAGFRLAFIQLANQSTDAQKIDCEIGEK